MNYYFSKGKIVYKNDGWIVMECPHSIVNYYKFWIEKFIGKKISTSYHSPHVTVVPAKHEGDLKHHKFWGKYDGQFTEFKYYSHIYTDNEWFFKGQYFWLRVDCPLLAKVRTELGLKPHLKWPMHLTIGYCGTNERPPFNRVVIPKN